MDLRRQARRVYSALRASIGRPLPARVEDVLSVPRARYKHVWNTMSRTERAARFAVAGHADDAVSLQSARNAVATLQATVGIRPDDTVLEIGAGYGRVGAEVAPLCRAWVGLDVSENMVRTMTQRLAGLPNASAVVGSGFDLAGLETSSFDLAYCTVVFMHLDEWDRYGYVRDAFRVLRPGGRLYVDNINLCSEGGWTLFEQHRAMDPRERPPHISKTSTPQELRTYLERAGFEDIAATEDAHMIILTGRKPDPTG